jgi:hypothetical protein
VIEKDTPLVIGDKEIKNRFFLGTGKFKSKADMKRSIIESKAQVVTVAMRRVDVDRHPENILEYIPEDTILMVNTPGARNIKYFTRQGRKPITITGMRRRNESQNPGYAQLIWGSCWDFPKWQKMPISYFYTWSKWKKSTLVLNTLFLFPG